MRERDATAGVFRCALFAAMSLGCQRKTASVVALESLPVVNGATELGALFSVGRTPIVTGWEAAPERLAAAECAECHRQTHQEWTASAHAQAFTNSNFQAAYAQEPLSWCRNCHAPLSAQEAERTPRAEGVSCAACHVRDGQILGAHAMPASRATHAVRAVEGFDTPELCAGCHQFAFPKSTLKGPNGAGLSAVEYSREPMQDTLAEWRASGAAVCGHCHGGGHRWSGPSDVQWLAVQFEKGTLIDEEDGVVSLRVNLRPRGHALPTGDPFRALHLEVALDPDFAQIWYRTRYGRQFDGRMTSDFTLVKGGMSRDTRIMAQTNVLSATFARPKTARLYARLRYFFHDRWVNGEWEAEAATARVLWSDEFALEEP